MTSCYPALRGKFGQTEYFLTTMAVGDLVDRVKFPVEMPEWETSSIEERYQRSLNMKRVYGEIAPYFAGDPRRFTGSLVLAVQNDEKMIFERMSKVAGQLDALPGLYKGAASEVGFVVMSGQEVLVPLDGQHRAKAFKVAIEGYAPNEGEPPVIRPNTGLARETVAVILVRFEQGRSRYIFNKINRYAKPTVKGDKLITDDDDAVAVITRALISEGVLPARLVKISSNTLGKGAGEFTTLATLYEANKKLAMSLPVPLSRKPERMLPNEREEKLDQIRAEWRRLLSGIGTWKRATAVPGEDGDRGRAELREKSLLGRPAGQTSLINGYALACMKDRARRDRDELVARIDKIDWDMGAPHWRGLLVSSSGKLKFGKPATNNAGAMTAHLIGVPLTQKEKEQILKFQYGGDPAGQRLPRPLVF